MCQLMLIVNVAMGSFPAPAQILLTWKTFLSSRCVVSSTCISLSPLSPSVARATSKDFSLDILGREGRSIGSQAKRGGLRSSDEVSLLFHVLGIGGGTSRR